MMSAIVLKRRAVLASFQFWCTDVASFHDWWHVAEEAVSPLLKNPFCFNGRFFSFYGTQQMSRPLVTAKCGAHYQFK